MARSQALVAELRAGNQTVLGVPARERGEREIGPTHDRIVFEEARVRVHGLSAPVHRHAKPWPEMPQRVLAPIEEGDEPARRRVLEHARGLRVRNPRAFRSYTGERLRSDEDRGGECRNEEDCGGDSLIPTFAPVGATVGKPGAPVGATVGKPGAPVGATVGKPGAPVGATVGKPGAPVGATAGKRPARVGNLALNHGDSSTVAHATKSGAIRITRADEKVSIASTPATCSRYRCGRLRNHPAAATAMIQGTQSGGGCRQSGRHSVMSRPIRTVSRRNSQSSQP